MGILVRYNLFSKFHFPRFLFTIFFLGLYVIAMIVVVAFRLLDELIFFNYRRQVLKPPLFIISSPRSGTTFLHRVLSVDHRRFSLMHLHHTLVPSISFYKLMDALYYIDGLLLHPFRFIFLKITSWVFRGWDGIHTTGFDVPEEDEGIWFTMMLSPALILLSPFYNRFSYLTILDNFTEKEKSKMMSYYENCLLRMQYHFGKEKTLLIKSVMASGRIEMYIKNFSKSRFIYLYRSPVQTVPSYMSMFTKIWKFHSKDILGDKAYYQTASLAPIQFYSHFQKLFFQSDCNSVIQMEYEDLIKNPMAAIKNIYDSIDIIIEYDLESSFQAEIDKSATYSSKHQYSLDQFGLDLDELLVMSQPT